jgi:ElaB/YqjD/DUF883 family membrane-anchored ribosome-binding protein
MSSDPDDRDPDEIRVEIAQTRTEMGGTIDAIQQRLAPEVLTEQAKDFARDATGQAKSAAQDLLQDAVREVKDAAKEITTHAVHEVKDAAHDVTVDAKDAAWDATIGRAEDAVSSAGETVRGVRSIVIDTIKQHPIPAALAGLSLYWMYKHRSVGPTSPPTTSGGYRIPSPPQTPGTAQAYPLRTGYVSQQQRDAMASAARSAGTRSAYGTGVPQYGGESDEGMLSSAADHVAGAASAAGQMASDAASSAGHLAGEAASTAGHMASGAGETAMDLGSTIVDLIKQNPVPSALVGLGLGWLYLNHSSGQPDHRARNGSHDPYAQTYRSGDQSSGGVGSMVGRATDQVGDLASSAQEHIGDMAGSVQERVGNLAGSTQEHVGDMAGAVMDQTRRTPGQIQRMIQEKPLMAAAIAGSLGAVVGLWLPPTEVESHLMGSARGQVMDRAQEVASETMDKVQDVAQEVRSTLKEEVQTKGLTV